MTCLPLARHPLAGSCTSLSVGTDTIRPPHVSARSLEVTGWPQWRQVKRIMGSGMVSSVVL